MEVSYIVWKVKHEIQFKKISKNSQQQWRTNHTALHIEYSIKSLGTYQPSLNKSILQ